MSVGPKTAEESPKYRSPEEIFVDNESVGKQSLANILKNHKQWLETDRRSGDRAVLDGADLSRANLSGANLQEARLNEAKLSGANLSEANLCEAQLNRADLSGANLQKAELKKALLLEANLEAASLDVAQLQKANLSQANLRGASLHWADLTEADLLETQLEGADLLKARLGAANFEGTDLTGAKGLLSGQLGGTVLAGAKLTQDLTKFEPLRIVEEVSKNARTVFVAILLGCLYCLLSIALATDADLLMNRESAPLPFVDRSIPIVDFFFVAPVLLLCVYLYFHFYLQNLWGTLATLPAIFPDGAETAGKHARKPSALHRFGQDRNHAAVPIRPPFPSVISGGSGSLPGGGWNGSPARRTIRGAQTTAAATKRPDWTSSRLR